MTYFTKYLPVDGEVKIGDIYYNHLIHTYQSRTCEEDNSYVGFQKVNLFLCTNDLQAGDSIQNVAGEKGICDGVGNGNIWYHIGDSYGIYSGQKYWFKVVGEISPEALTFVNEGAIIDEEGIQLCYWPGGSGSEIWNVVPWDKIKFLRNNTDKFYTMAKIQCGKCKHFH